MDERDLIQAAQRGDLEAFNRLVLDSQDTVYNHACWLCGDPALAVEIVQETFLRAFRRLGTFRGSSFRAWVLQIADRLRQEMVRQEERSSAGADVRWGEQAGLDGALYSALESLPEEQRMPLVLVDMLAMDYAEAAEALRISTSTLKSRLATARLSLHERLSAGSTPG